MSVLLRFDASEVLAMGAIAAVFVVGMNRPELAPVTSMIAGAGSGWLKHRVIGFCIFKGADRCRRERNAAMISGAFMGAGVGVIRRSYERKR